jgi:transcriptional regulator with XRE-family HTH domain
METIQKRLIAIRKYTGLSQAAFAERLGLTHTSISFMENGKTKITEQNIKTICYEFGVSIDWFRTGEGNMLLIKSLITEQVVAKFAQLSPALQAKVISYIDGLLDAQNVLTLGVEEKTVQVSPPERGGAITTSVKNPDIAIKKRADAAESGAAG